MARSQARKVFRRPAFDSLTLIVFLLFLLSLSATIVLFVVWYAGISTSAPADLLPQIPISGQSIQLAPTKTAFEPALSAAGTPAPPAGSSVVEEGAFTLTEPLRATPVVTTPQPTPIPWNGVDRVTILLMGIDQRDWSEERDIPRADTMILLTIDPVTRQAGMLSIPRDLWVEIPGIGQHKINTAYRWGELYEFQGGGPGLAMRTVQRALGIPVQYYVLVDFNAFVALIDELGGLDIHIREEIKIDPVGPGNTLTLEPGVQTLSGAEALAYARNRHTEFDDFDRSSRQQEVIMAVREQVLTFDMLPSLVLKAPVLFTRLSEGIRTDLSLDQMVSLAWLAASVPEANIKRSVFDLHTDFIYSKAETSDGVLDILILKPESLQLLREEMFPAR